jgi:hypothetical protein
MQQLKVIENKGQRVLTTAQLAESYGATAKHISYNFNRNAGRYKEGKHFFKLIGDQKLEFVNRHEIQDGLINAAAVYLWTEKGAWLHAKSLNTDKAWDAYEKLIDDYYEIKRPMSIEDMIITQAESVKEVKKEVADIKKVVDNEVWVNERMKKEIQDTVSRRVFKLRESDHDAHYQTIYSSLKRFFGVSKYDKIPRKDFDEAINFITGWYPPVKKQLSQTGEGR